MKKAIAGLAIILFLSFSLLLAINPVRAIPISETVYINPDGSITPSDAPITNVGCVYTFTENITGSLIVEKNGIIVCGNGYFLIGDPSDPSIELNSTAVPCMQSPGDPVEIGVTLEDVCNVTIKGLGITDFVIGIGLADACHNCIIGNSISDCIAGIYLECSNCNNIASNCISPTVYGIYLEESSYNTINSNYVTCYFEDGITLECCSNCNCLSCNQVEASSEILAATVSAGLVESENVYGIFVDSSKYNGIFGNTISFNEAGVFFNCSCYNQLSYNTIEYNDVGVILEFSSYNKLSQNLIECNQGTYTDTEAWIGEGIVLYLSCYNAIDCNTICNNYYGIALVYSSGNCITNNKIMDNYESLEVVLDGGIELYSSCHNYIYNNLIIGNGDEGVTLLCDSTCNTIYWNKIICNTCGLDIDHSDYNIISTNLIMDNCVGVCINCSSCNIFYHNSFIYNTCQVSISPGSKDYWDNGHPCGGNYWSCFTPCHPYVINECNIDWYPLTKPIITP